MSLSEITTAPSIDKILKAQNINGFEAPGGTDKQTIHSYGPVYEQLFKPFKKKQCTVLEIGVQLGGSMLLWHDLCPQSHVIGVDTQVLYHPSIFERMEESRYSFVLGDGYAKQTIDAVKACAPNGIDFAIDDGPHTLQSQCMFLQYYLPLLNEGGVAVIEDVQEYEWFNSLLSFVPDDYTSEIVDRRQIQGRYDDLMLIVRK